MADGAEFDNHNLRCRGRINATTQSFEESHPAPFIIALYKSDTKVLTI